jgi:hypothetical protein
VHVVLVGTLELSGHCSVKFLYTTGCSLMWLRKKLSSLHLVTRLYSDDLFASEHSLVCIMTVVN